VEKRKWDEEIQRIDEEFKKLSDVEKTEHIMLLAKLIADEMEKRVTTSHYKETVDEFDEER